MKKILIFSLILFSLICNTNVLAKTNYFTNYNGVVLNKEEYEFISKMFYDGFQKNLTQEDYNIIFSNNYINGQFDSNNNVIMPLNTTHDTNSKTLIIKSSCTSSCLITTILTWKTMPLNRSYDLIGANLENTNLITSPVTKIENSTDVNESDEILYSNSGFGVSLKLLSGSNLVVSQYYTVSKGGIVYASYQHATKNLSLADSKKYTISKSGVGNVFKFSNLTIQGYYDGMGGVYINV